MNTFVKFIMAMSLAGFLIGCEQGPAEEAGENIDEAVEEVQELLVHHRVVADGVFEVFLFLRVG